MCVCVRVLLFVNGCCLVLLFQLQCGSGGGGGGSGADVGR